MRPLDLLEPVKALLELLAVASAQAGLLALLVLANGAIATAPAAGRLSSIAFYLRKLARELEGDEVLCLGLGKQQGKFVQHTLRCLHNSHLERAEKGSISIWFKVRPGSKTRRRGRGKGKALDLDLGHQGIVPGQLVRGVTGLIKQTSRPKLY